MRFVFVSVFLVVFLAIGRLHSATVYSNGDGNWESAGSWTTGVPVCGDTVIILFEDTITVTSQLNIDEISTPACSTAMYVEVRGNLNFQTGKKLALPCGSGIFIAAGGWLTGGTGGGSANIIDVCQTTIWKSGDGDIQGARWVGSGLPIVLKSFDAEVVSDVIQINWTTLSEINNDYFTIEKSIDLKNNNDLCQIDGAGNSTSEIDYSYIDLQPEKGVQYYRLKQTDFDGKKTYSNWIAVNRHYKVKADISVFPTITNGAVNIQFNEIPNDNYTIRLFSNNGEILMEKKVAVEESNGTMVIDFPDNIKGLLFLNIAGSELNHTEKLISH